MNTSSKKNKRQNVTLTAESSLLRRARRRASVEHTTINSLFRQWLEEYSREAGSSAKKFDELMVQIGYAVPGKKFNRDEMNER